MKWDDDIINYRTFHDLLMTRRVAFTYGGLLKDKVDC